MFIKAMWFSLFKVHRRCHFVQRWNWWKIRFGSILLFRQSSSLLNNILLYKPKHADLAALRDIVKSFLEQKWKKITFFFLSLANWFLTKRNTKRNIIDLRERKLFQMAHSTLFQSSIFQCKPKVKNSMSNTIFEQIFPFFFVDRFFICNALWIIVFWCLWYWFVVQMMILNEFFDNRPNLQIHTHHKLLYDSTLTT